MHRILYVVSGLRPWTDLKQDYKKRFFGTFYGEPSSKSWKALLCRHFIENIGHNCL